MDDKDLAKLAPVASLQFPCLLLSSVVGILAISEQLTSGPTESTGKFNGRPGCRKLGSQLGMSRKVDKISRENKRCSSKERQEKSVQWIRVMQSIVHVNDYGKHECVLVVMMLNLLLLGSLLVFSYACGREAAPLAWALFF
jgi:hypothetical protein